MEISSSRWLSELGLEDSSFIQQYEMNSLDPFTSQQIAAALGEDFRHSFSSDSYSSHPSLTPRSSTTFICSSMEGSHNGEERPSKLLKTNSWNSHTMERVLTADNSSPNILSFGNQSSSHNHQNFYGNVVVGVKPKDEMVSPTDSNVQSEILISQAGSHMNHNYMSKAVQGSKRVSTVTTRPPSHAQDHIIAERKRREKLSQRFIALSAIVPGLKKMDKASVLGDAIKYVKQLQERVQTLEDQSVKKTMESVVFVKKSQLCVDDDVSSTEENFDGSTDEPLPEIEARVSDEDILIRIHCEKRKGTLVKVLAEIEKLHLSIVTANSAPFANSALDITVTAKKEEFCMPVKDLVRSLRAAFSNFK